MGKDELLSLKSRLFPAYTDEEFDNLLWTCTAYPFAKPEVLREQLQFAANVGNDFDAVWYIADGLMSLAWQDMKAKRSATPIDGKEA